MLFYTFYDGSFFMKFPMLVTDLEQGRTEALQEPLELWLGSELDPFWGDAAETAHFCSEEQPFVDYDLAERNAEAAPNTHIRNEHLATISWSQDSCRLWNVAATPPVESQAISTAIPTLFLHGGLDPVLPVEDLEGQLQYFDHHACLIFNDGSHWDTYGERATKAAGYFIDHKQLDPAQDNCNPWVQVP